MSTETLTPAGEDLERTDGLIRRTFAAELSTGDGRTVDVRIVPFGERIKHNDGLGGVPVGQMYEEEWMPGVFDHQLNAAHRLLANFEHQKGIGDIVGKGVTLRSEADGYHGSFRILDGAAGDTLLQLIPDVVDMVSLEARPMKSVRSASGVVQRVKAHLAGIAFTRFGAYQGAKVLAVREDAGVVDEATMPVDLNPEVVERCRRLGIALPQRYEAHPVETDTPDESGTPADGTRPSDQDDIGGNGNAGAKDAD